jgi:hypothetical protein
MDQMGLGCWVYFIHGPDASILVRSSEMNWYMYTQNTLDHGTSSMIIDGRIKVKPGSISRFTHDGLEFEDGSKVPADVVVCATG